MSQRGLARELDVAESGVRRMLNPDHATKAATIDHALCRTAAAGVELPSRHGCPRSHRVPRRNRDRGSLSGFIRVGVVARARLVSGPSHGSAGAIRDRAQKPVG